MRGALRSAARLLVEGVQFHAGAGAKEFDHVEFDQEDDV